MARKSEYAAGRTGFVGLQVEILDVHVHVRVHGDDHVHEQVEANTLRIAIGYSIQQRNTMLPPC